MHWTVLFCRITSLHSNTFLKVENRKWLFESSGRRTQARLAWVAGRGVSRSAGRGECPTTLPPVLLKPSQIRTTSTYRFPLRGEGPNPLWVWPGRGVYELCHTSFLSYHCHRNFVCSVSPDALRRYLTDPFTVNFVKWSIVGIRGMSLERSFSKALTKLSKLFIFKLYKRHWDKRAYVYKDGSKTENVIKGLMETWYHPL